MATESTLYPYCVYTLLHTEKLEGILAGTREPTERENQRWVTGQKLLHEATAQGQALPILFGPADKGTGLVYWAILTAVDLDARGTTYRFTDLVPLPGNRPLSSLRLMNGGQPMPDSNIFPYALCETPSFLRGAED